VERLKAARPFGRWVCAQPRSGFSGLRPSPAPLGPARLAPNGLFMTRPDPNYVGAPGTNGRKYSQQGLRIPQDHRRAFPEQSRICQTLGVSPEKPGGFPLESETSGEARGLKEVERLKAARPFGRSLCAQSVSGVAGLGPSPALLALASLAPKGLFIDMRTTPGLLAQTGATICRSTFASPETISGSFRINLGIVKLWESPRQSLGGSRSTKSHKCCCVDHSACAPQPPRNDHGGNQRDTAANSCNPWPPLGTFHGFQSCAGGEGAIWLTTSLVGGKIGSPLFMKF
jgi:hypothetical protein